MSIAPLAGGPGGSPGEATTPLDIATLQVDDAAGAFEPMDLLAGAGAHAGGYGKRRAWGINALRETPRLPRHAVLKAARPFGFPGGTRVTLRIAQEDGSIGQGVGRFRLAATAAADPLIGGEAGAAHRVVRWRVPRPSAPLAATPISPPSSGAPRRCSRRRARRSRPRARRSSICSSRARW